MAKKIEIEIHNKLVVIPNEAAALLSVGKEVILIYMKTGVLPFMRVGRDYKIWVSDLKELQQKLLYKELDIPTKKLTDCNPDDVKVG